MKKIAVAAGGQGERGIGRRIAGVDGQLMVAAFGVRIEIVGGRETPAVRGQDEPVVTKAIAASTSAN